jgi:hypothetical protein
VVPGGVDPSGQRSQIVGAGDTGQESNHAPSVPTPPNPPMERLAADVIPQASILTAFAENLGVLSS